MVNFEMYQISAWNDKGLTKHVENIVNSCEVKVKSSVKNLLIGGSLIAGAFMTLSSSQLNMTQVANPVMMRENLAQVQTKVSNELVSVDFWPKLINVLSNAERVEFVSTEFDPEPLA